MAAINKYRNMNGEVSLFGFARTEDKRAFKSDEDKQLYEERIEEKVASGDRLPGNTYNMMTNMENKDNMIARLEKELSTVQSKKTKAIEALAKLRLEKQKIAGESKGNEVVRAGSGRSCGKSKGRREQRWMIFSSLNSLMKAYRCGEMIRLCSSGRCSTLNLMNGRQKLQEIWRQTRRSV